MSVFGVVRMRRVEIPIAVEALGLVTIASLNFTDAIGVFGSGGATGRLVVAVVVAALELAATCLAGTG